MHSGKKDWDNLRGQDQCMKEPFRYNTRIRVYGLSILKCKWKISSLIMQEMFGKEQFTICQDKINFGLNIPIWKKS